MAGGRNRNEGEQDSLGEGHLDTNLRYLKMERVGDVAFLLKGKKNDERECCGLWKIEENGATTR